MMRKYSSDFILYFNQDVSVGVAVLLAVLSQQCHSTLVLAGGVDSVNEVSLIIVAEHKLEHCGFPSVQ